MKTETRDQILKDPVTDPMRNLTLEEKFKVFCLLNGPLRMDFDLVNQNLIPKAHSARFEVYCPVSAFPSQILDVSEKGLRLCDHQEKLKDDPDFLHIQLGPEKHTRVKTRRCWEARNRTSGHEIVDADPAWEAFISDLSKKIA